MTHYLAVARITVGADDKTQRRELLEGLERVLYELRDQGLSIDDLERECESLIEQIHWDSPNE